MVLLIEKGSERFIIANIYAPTQDRPDEQVQLIDLLQDTIAGWDAQNIILGGDFNLCLDPKLDKTSTPHSQPPPEVSHYRNRVAALCEDLYLSDLWRRLNPTKKSFSFRAVRFPVRFVAHFKPHDMPRRFDNRTLSSIRPCIYFTPGGSQDPA